MNLRRELETRLQAALAAATGEQHPALVGPASRPQFGDYQANGVMAAAKKIRTNPRRLAEKVLQHVKLDDLAEKLEVAGPGFINITLKDEWLSTQIAEQIGDERLGVERALPARTVVVDYSSPNLAKEMHVGHLRSTIIGDALVRVLEFLGHKTIRQNHVGDWGTQFGMLTAYAERQGFVSSLDGDASGQAVGDESFQIADMEQFYVRAKQLFDTEAEFADQARRYVVKLQGGDHRVIALWNFVRQQSLRHAQQVYEKLGVLLNAADVRGESAYNDELPCIIAELDRAGLLTESQGAKCVFLDEFKDKDGRPLPVIVQKSDGGYLYATTDLAAIRYRVTRLGADRILYVTDARQSLHFRQVFAVARKAGFAGENVSLEHVAFGMMLGPDGRPFRTREGGTVKLMDLLDEAVQRAAELIEQKNPDLPDKQRVARAVGIGALKYADLSQNRTSDYVFSWDKMLALEGNTAPYMQYAYARVRSIFRKGRQEAQIPDRSARIAIMHPAERALAVKLLGFPETLEAVAAECLPHLLCNYLYELAGAFMGFYENCPVLQSDEPVRSGRLALCDLTARTIERGLGLLGIETVEQM